ncbi:MAG: Uma2 family endonuclease [Oscillatoriales cyanobacterium]|nr:MAG: Uma2 family endonuclease [Oscillatoriales cyanobacterium]
MVAVNAYFNPDDYLAIEANSPVRHEYRDGLVYAMAGSSQEHTDIAINLFTILRSPLRGKNCRAHALETKLQLPNRNAFYYPDVLVTCDPRDRDDRYIKRHPSFIAEVLSPSTEKFDRGDKFSDYQQLETLKTYWLIFQDQIKVEVRQKTDVGDWETQIYKMGDRIAIPTLGITIAINDLYEDTELLIDH